MKQEIMEFIFNNSKIFDVIRSMVHSNYKDEKDILIKNLKKDRLILDFGCGIGQFSDIFEPKYYFGVDLDPRYIEFCKKNRKGRFIAIKDAPPYEFKKNYFDQIFISAVVHHIDKDKLSKISKELSRILKDDGRLMVIDHFTIKEQKNLFCKLLIKLDRGRYFRNHDDIIKIFSNEFKVDKMKTFKNGPYRDYMVIMKKNQSKGRT